MQMARTTPAEWAKRVERWHDSGLTAKEFAAEISVNAGTLSQWKYKLRRQAAPAENTVRPRVPREKLIPPGFLRVVPVEAKAVAAATVFEIVLGGRTIVRVPNDFDETALLRLVRALGGL
jgi:transposase